MKPAPGLHLAKKDFRAGVARFAGRFRFEGRDATPASFTVHE
jgi:hypothetical protein